jgi:hypothetical protein
MRKTMLFASMMMFLFGAYSLFAQSSAAPNGNAQAQFTMGPSYVHLPEKYFVLIRRGKEIGAVRFIRIEQDAMNNGKSTYESYFQGDGSGSFRNSNLVKRTGEIDIKPMRGIHAFAWQPGQNKLWVGKWWFGCSTPSLMNMSSHFSEKDEGYEFAPTSAQTVAEIDASDKRLKWFRFNPDARTIVPLSDLPK